MNSKKRKRGIGERRTTYTGRIVYNSSKKHPFTLNGVARISNQLFNHDDITPQNAASIFYLYELYTDWMDRRGLFTAIYGSGAIANNAAAVNALPVGTEAWKVSYVAFIKWFDGVVAGLSNALNILGQIAPELKPVIGLVLDVSKLYNIARQYFPIE
jgi:hypothetical protein